LHQRRARLREEFHKERCQIEEQDDIDKHSSFRPDCSSAKSESKDAVDEGLEAGKMILAQIRSSPPARFEEGTDADVDAGNTGIVTPRIPGTPQTPEEVGVEAGHPGGELENASERLLEALKQTSQTVAEVQARSGGESQIKQVAKDEDIVDTPSPGAVNVAQALAADWQMMPPWPALGTYDASGMPPGPTPLDIHHVTLQVEYWFSDDNLIHDQYMRSLMLNQGWVWLGVLQNFRRMQQMGVDLWALRLALIPSQELELDGTAYYARIRNKERRDRWLSVSVQSQ
jgi:hypothetical protein